MALSNESVQLDNQTFNGRKRHAAVAAILLIVAISWMSIFDRKAQEYVDESTVQALSIFGTFRLANAAISVIKSVEVNAFVASVQFGQGLDPVDDLIEDASSVLKFAIGSLITQKILSEIVSTDFFKLLITASGLLLIASLYIQQGRYSGFLIKMFALAGLARFLFVLVIVLNGLVDQAFVEEKTDAEHKNLQGSSENIASVGQTTRMDSSNPQSAAVREQIGELEVKREAALQAIQKMRMRVTEAQGKLDASEAELSEIKESLDLTDRYFSNNPEYEKYKADVELREKGLSEALSRLEEHTEELENTDDELEELTDSLRGEGKGFIASAKDMMDLGRIKEEAEELINSTLNLMALLTLKAVIIPIIFLVLLLKGFRYIWGVDARTFASRQLSNVKEELSGKA
ncbi:MAG: hypothetical protein RIK85_10175 [Marinobacter sp.]